jgi:tRNA nucleotidyltransferase/poly(A) polymerase
VTNSNSSNSGGRVGITAAMEAALNVAAERGERVFVVGGVVRDALMGRRAAEHDLDVVVEGQGIPFAHRLAEVLGCALRVHEPFLTAKLVAPFSSPRSADAPYLDEVDVATAREEVYERPGALPVVRPATIERDLWRRDFSANAIALPLATFERVLSGSLPLQRLKGEAVDPSGGISDISNCTLRILHPRSFIDDPTRLFRAVRYIVRLSFHFDMQTLAGFLEAVKSGALATLSPRRVWNELVVALEEESPSEVVQEFLQRGLLSHLPLVSARDPQWLLEALQRLEVIRGTLGNGIFAEAAKVLLIAGLLREGREDVARAVQESNRILARASTVLEADRNQSALKTIPDAAAAYCVHCTEPLRILLQACVTGEKSGSGR